MAKNYTGQGDIEDGASEANRIAFVVRQMLNQHATATLVQVKGVGTDTVDVQPMVAQLDGAGNAIPHGTIHGLPVCLPRAGGAAIVMTPVVGDIGIAVFCHNDISSVKKTRAPANPGSRRRFDWADGVYLGGLLGAAPTSYIRFETDGTITVQPAGGMPVMIDAEVRASDLYVNGHKVVGAQQPALPPDATDLGSALALVNALKAGLKAHGLFAG